MISLLLNRKLQVPLIALLSVLLVAIPLTGALAQQQTTPQEPSAADIIRQAESDADADESGTIYGVGGFLCGIFGWLLATLSSPDVPAARLVGKSSNYVVMYSDAYKRKAKSNRTNAACIGWGIGSAVSLAIILSSSSSSK